MNPQANQDSNPTFKFFNPMGQIKVNRGTNLPHWQQEGVVYFVTFRLADSLPQAQLRILANQKSLWLKNNPKPWNGQQEAEYLNRFPRRIQKLLDQNYGSLILQNEEANSIVRSAIKYFNDERYILDEFVVASNHVHVLISPIGGNKLCNIVHSWKSFSAKEILKLEIAKKLSTAPKVWQTEYWDHIVRSEASLLKFREYIKAHKQ